MIVFSRRFRFDGYAAYGVSDGKFKYGFGSGIRLGRYSNSWIGGEFINDIREIASTDFLTDPKKIKVYDGRPFNITTFYSTHAWRGYIESRLIPKTESVWQIEYASINPLFDYTFVKNNTAYVDYNLASAKVSFQWNPFSDFMQTPQGRLETERGYPKFAMQYTQFVSGFFKSDFNFGKFDFRAEYEKKLSCWSKNNRPISCRLGNR